MRNSSVESLTEGKIRGGIKKPDNRKPKCGPPAPKALFHPKWFSYNDKAAELDGEVRNAIEPIVDKWIDAGYSPREMESIMLTTMSMAICVKHMKKNCELMKAEREERDGKRNKSEIKGQPTQGAGLEDS